MSVSINFLSILIVDFFWMEDWAFLVRAFDQVFSFRRVDSGTRKSGNIVIQAIVSFRSDMF